MVDDQLVNGLISSYDPNNKHEAPAVLGHDSYETDGAPAFGWLNRLYKDSKGLFGDFNITDELADWIKKKLYKKISISFYPKESPMSPEKGQPYIRHVAFLGAEPPVIKGLEPYSLSEKTTKNITMMIDYKLNEDVVMTPETSKEWLTALLSDGDSGFTDEIVSFDPEPSEENNFLVQEDGSISGGFLDSQGIKYIFNIVEDADGYTREFMPESPEEADMIQNEGIQTPEELAEDMQMTVPDEELGEGYKVDKLEKNLLSEGEEGLIDEIQYAKMMDYDKMMTELAEERAMLEKEKALMKKEKMLGEYRNFSEGLYRDGVLLKSQVEPDGLANFMVTLSTSAVNLSEGEASPVEWFKSFLSKLPKAIDLSEVAKPSPEDTLYPDSLPVISGNPVMHDPESSEVHNKVISLCEKKGIKNPDSRTYLNTLKEVLNNVK